MPRSIDDLALVYRDMQLALLVKEAPASGAWSYELKFDGYRILALKSGKSVRLLSRRHQDWTDDFGTVAMAIASVAADECVLDGEVCALDAAGRLSFQALQNRKGARAHLVYFAFDLLALNGEDLRRQPIEARRALLAGLLGDADKDRGIIVSAVVESDPVGLMKLAREAGMEGIVAKAAGSFYVAARNGTWLKLKFSRRQELAIIGWVPLLESRPAVGSLLLAVKDPGDGRFHFAGKVGTGFTDKMRRELFELLRPDESKTPTAEDVPPLGDFVRFVTPKHAAEIAFTEWTKGGHIRHPSFQGLRPDKSPDDCVREDPDPRATVA